MADANEELQRLGEMDDQAKDEDLPRFSTRHKAIDEAWLAAAPWPKTFVSTGNRLHRLGLATQARAKEQPLWAWYGPAVPMRGLTTGQGPYPGKGR
jgi:hypothetical protein